MRLLITNGYLIDPSQGVNTGRNLLVEDGRVAGLLDRSETVPEGAEVLDATGFASTLAGDATGLASAFAAAGVAAMAARTPI